MSSELIEIFVFAGIAGFLIFKLYTVLGQKTGFERPKESSLVQPEPVEKQPQSSFAEDLERLLNASLKKLVKSIKRKDNRFNLNEFLKGATQAFEMILEAFSRADTMTLKKLLGAELYGEFETTIEERKSHQETLETILVKIESVRLVEGHMQGNVARVTVEFQTEQTHVVRNKAGEIIEGSPKQIEQLVDLWTFERNLTQSNPNWILIKTAT
jgi:predicted lipid-binding transport protein (Tim44 family)